MGPRAEINLGVVRIAFSHRTMIANQFGLSEFPHQKEMSEYAS